MPISLVGYASNGRTALPLIENLSPAIILVDIKLPGLSGFQICEAVHSRWPLVKTLALYNGPSPYDLYRIESSRFYGAIDKTDCTEEMLGGIIQRAVSGTERYFAPSLLQARLARRSDPLSFEKLLTEREQLVLGFIGLGLSDSEVAQRLGITKRTAETFRANIMRKLGIHSAPKLVYYSIEHGFQGIAAEAMAN